MIELLLKGRQLGGVRKAGQEAARLSSRRSTL
jgi:hypothetical protein